MSTISSAVWGTERQTKLEGKWIRHVGDCVIARRARLHLKTDLFVVTIRGSNKDGVVGENGKARMECL